MNEYLEAEKEAGTYEAAQESECDIETAKERFARKSHQVVTMRAQPSFSEGGSSWTKAWRGSGVEAPSQGISRPEAGLKMIFSTDDEYEEEGELVSNTSLHHRNQHNKGPAVSMQIEASEELAIAEESAAAKEPKAMEETERVEIDDPPQPKVASASLMISKERVEM